MEIWLIGGVARQSQNSIRNPNVLSNITVHLIYLDATLVSICKFNIDKNIKKIFFDAKTSGLRTLPEDIADNGGLSLAFLGYKEWLKNNKDLLLPGLGLTHEQQFFLSFGQVSWR